MDRRHNSTLLYGFNSSIQTKRNNSQRKETNTNKKLTYSIPRRIGVGVHYGPEAIAVSINSEFFPFRQKNIFLGIEAGLFITHLNIGTHIGYQKNFLLSQIDLDYSLYGNNDFFSVNPKIGLRRLQWYAWLVLMIKKNEIIFLTLTL